MKAYFKEAINSLIVRSFHDQLFKSVQNNHLGAILGNLLYSKLIFECYPNYPITLQSKKH